MSTEAGSLLDRHSPHKWLSFRSAPTRWDFSRVDIVDPRTGVVLCPIRPLDKGANADGQRRRLTPVGADLSPLPSTGLAPLLRELLAEYAATGMPPAYLASAEPTAAPATPATPTNPTEANPA